MQIQYLPLLDDRRLICLIVCFIQDKTRFIKVNERKLPDDSHPLNPYSIQNKPDTLITVSFQVRNLKPSQRNFSILQQSSIVLDACYFQVIFGLVINKFNQFLKNCKFLF